MKHSRGLYSKINLIHERALRIVYKNFSTPFKRLLAKYKPVISHNQNLQQQAIEIFKVKMGIPSIIMKEIFSFSGKNNYNLKSGTRLTRPSLHMTHYRTVFITNLGANIWHNAKH